jgi:microcystin-dependent protein
VKILLLIAAIVFVKTGNTQNVGIGVSNPVERLEVNGKLRTESLSIPIAGAALDFYIKTNAQGAVGTRKAHVALGFNYIICFEGIEPSPSSGMTTDGPYVGDIRLFCGSYAPIGWKFCDGQYLSKGEYNALFTVVGNAFGETVTTFAIPDLRGLAPVGVGTSPAGYIWTRGQKSN